jgi:hypothetical protein
MIDGIAVKKSEIEVAWSLSKVNHLHSRQRCDQLVIPEARITSGYRSS